MAVNLINDDNVKFMKGLNDKAFDIGIIDPQTGQGEDGKHRSRNNHFLKQKNGEKLLIKNNHRHKEWDDAPPTQEYWDEFFRVTKHQIIMCENYLHFEQKKDSPGRIVWNLLRENNFSACQVMWTDLSNKIDYFEYLWNGMMQGVAINSRVQQGNKQLNEKRIHPSQKPVIVYRHLLKNYCEKGWSVFDTHGGSASLAIACDQEGFSLTSIEKDMDIYNDSVKRFNDYKSQGTLWQ